MDLILGVVREREVATLLVTHDRTHLCRMDAVHRVVDGSLTREYLLTAGG
jgi:putative ABC transport system ATP-binding protein